MGKLFWYYSYCINLIFFSLVNRFFNPPPPITITKELIVFGVIEVILVLVKELMRFVRVAVKCVHRRINAPMLVSQHRRQDFASCHSQDLLLQKVFLVTLSIAICKPTLAIRRLPTTRQNVLQQFCNTIARESVSHVCQTMWTCKHRFTSQFVNQFGNYFDFRLFLFD